jgi:flagellar hook-length control protein FliK
VAVEMMAIAGIAPATAAQPGAAASSAGAPEGGEDFASVIAAALSTPEDGTAASGVPGADASLLLAGLADSLDGESGVPVPTIEGSRLDRDAEAEGLQGALASMLLGALMRPVVPTQTTPALAAPSVAAATTAATPSVADGLTPVEVIASVAVQAQGSAGAAASMDDAVTAAGTTQDAAVLVPAGMEAVVPETYAGPGAVVAAETAASSGQANGSNESTASQAGISSAVATPLPETAPEADAAAAPSKPTVEVASMPAPAPLETTAADSSVQRAIELNEAPVERRTDDRTSGLVGIDAVRPAPLDVTAVTTTAPVIAATDGQSLASGVANSVQLATLRGDREMTLVLNPPDLGRLTVELTGDASGGLSISIHATSSEAHDLLQQHLPALRSGLEQRDVHIDSLQVDQQAPSSGPGWADGGGRESRGRGWNGRNDSGDDGAPQWSPLAALRRGSEAAGAMPSIAGTTTRSSALDVRA